jgi:hypothetical protein
MVPQKKPLTPQQRTKLHKQLEVAALDLGYMAAAYFGGGEISLEVNFDTITERVMEVRSIQKRLREGE